MNCEYIGLHHEQREATIRVGWICSAGHVTIINYCDTCFARADEVYKLQGYLMGCGFDASGKYDCAEKAGIMEAVRV